MIKGIEHSISLAYLLTCHQVVKHATLCVVPLELVVELLPGTSSQQWIELCLQSENASQHFQVGQANMFFKSLCNFMNCPRQCKH